MKKNVVIGLILVLALLLTACGGPNIEGKWISVYSKLGDTYHYRVGFVDLDIRGDKTITAKSSDELNGTWAKEGDQFNIIFEGEVGKAFFEGELLVISTPGGEIYYFSRDAKAFKDFPEGTQGIPEK